MHNVPVPTKCFDQQDIRLIEAARNGDLRLLRLLIEDGVDLDEASAEGTTALIAAASGGHVEIVSLLLEAGADPLVKDSFGFDARDTAVWFGDFKGVVMNPWREVVNLLEVANPSNK